MILKRSKNILWYYEEPKITEYELLTQYSPMMINSKNTSDTRANRRNVPLEHISHVL